MKKNALLNRCVEDPQQKPSGMTVYLMSGSHLTYKEDALNKAYRLGVSPTGAASTPWNICHKAGKSGSHPTYEPCSAFTLIELLVVVLIIGILAAVAVPQYQKAVIKSQYAKLKILAASIVQAQEVYYLANGQYATKFEELDIDMPGGKTDESTDSNYVYDWGFCAISDGKYAQVNCNNYKIDMGYQHRQAHATVEPNARKCQSHSLEETDIRNQICKAETGAVSGTEMPSYTTTSWKYQ